MRRQTESGLFSDAKELHLLASGDRRQSWKAFENIFGRYQTRIYRMALRYTRSKELAEEVVQEIFLSLWLNRAKLDHVEAFDAYLFVSARNMMKAVVRKALNARNYEAEYASDRDALDISLEESIHHDHCKTLINEAMKLLSPQQHEIFRLAKVQGLSLDDVADEMNISKQTVKNHLTRAMKTMRATLQALLSLSVLIVWTSGL